MRTIFALSSSTTQALTPSFGTHEEGGRLPRELLQDLESQFPWQSFYANPMTGCFTLEPIPIGDMLAR